MTRARATLADRFRDPRSVAPQLDDAVVRSAMLRADRMVVDDAAVRLAVTLAISAPREMRRMLDQIEFPAQPMWLEWSSRTMLQARLAEGTLISPEEADSRDPAAKTGLLIMPGLDNARELHSWCVEDADAESAKIAGEIMLWPIGITLYQPQDRRSESKGGNMIWGYGDDVDVAPLSGRAAYLVTQSKERLLGKDGVATAAHELSGWSRMTVAMLAMLQTVTIAGEPTRVPGSVRLGGRLQPNLSTRHLSLQVPHRIRNVPAYARRRLHEEATFRKRLHEVRAHYRHLDHQPRAPGWAPILVEGQTLWRKRIAGHLRGDPSLGVVEHDVTVVHGPKEHPAHG